MQFLKIGSTLAQKWKRMTQMSTPPFWGEFCEIFGVWSQIGALEGLFFWHLKTGTFAKTFGSIVSIFGRVSSQFLKIAYFQPFLTRFFPLQPKHKGVALTVKNGDNTFFRGTSHRDSIYLIRSSIRDILSFKGHPTLHSSLLSEHFY